MWRFGLTPQNESSDDDDDDEQIVEIFMPPDDGEDRNGMVDRDASSDEDSYVEISDSEVSDCGFRFNIFLKSCSFHPVISNGFDIGYGMTNEYGTKFI